MRRAIEKQGGGIRGDKGGPPNLTFPRRALIAGLSRDAQETRLPTAPRFDHGGPARVDTEGEQHALRRDWSRLGPGKSKGTGEGHAGTGTIRPEEGFEPPAEEGAEPVREPEARPPLPRATPERPHPPGVGWHLRRRTFPDLLGPVTTLTF